ncbi:hypothetical protein [Roseimaritima sediminicola]|uniref:hypothetical protein n=1 Tax=Roseimaritima sediminicola TaxID=2662066 RepID=UPI0012983EAD|nr:hypothetical protein [Roseimaritima sediminicola]
MTQTFQTHSGAVNTSTTPSVGASFTDGSNNTLRPTGISYPDGRTVAYGYGSSDSIDDFSNRVATRTDDDSTVLAEHDWLYRYDGLHRLQSADRGQLNTAHSAIQTLDLAQCWTLDPTGNWSHYRQDDNGDGFR